MLDQFLDWLAALPATPTYAVLMLLAAVENVFPPVPADVAVALGAFLAQRGEVSAPLLGVLCWLANQASALGVYLFARTHAGFFRNGAGRRLTPPRAMQAIEEAYARHGVLGIFLTRFLPGVRAAVLPFAAIAGMPALRALAAAGIASAIWYAFLIAAGALLGQNWQAVKALVANVNRVLALLGMLTAAAIAVWLYRKARER